MEFCEKWEKFHGERNWKTGFIVIYECYFKIFNKNLLDCILFWASEEKGYDKYLFLWKNVYCNVATEMVSKQEWDQLSEWFFKWSNQF